MPITACSNAIHRLRASNLQGEQRCQPWWRPNYFFGGKQDKNWRFHLKANLLLPVIITLQVLAILRSVTRRYSSDRARALTQHHHMPIEVGQLDEDVAFALRFYCVRKLSISPIVRHQPPQFNLGILNDSAKSIFKHITGRLEAQLQDSRFARWPNKPRLQKAILTASELFECA